MNVLVIFIILYIISFVVMFLGVPLIREEYKWGTGVNLVCGITLIIGGIIIFLFILTLQMNYGI